MRFSIEHTYERPDPDATVTDALGRWREAAAAKGYRPVGATVDVAIVGDPTFLTTPADSVTLHIEGDVVEGCHYCGTIERDLRPYGPGGAFVCRPCVDADPERTATAKAAFDVLHDAATGLSPTGAVRIGDQFEDHCCPILGHEHHVSPHRMCVLR